MVHYTFTFHYASTLSSWKSSFASFCIIYIPLCFYFIGRGDTDRPRRIQIYIPLCFYFIDKADMGLYQESGIYIPLCFYFIRDWDWSTAFTAKFTFHYASTLSMSESLGFLVVILIYIPLCFYFILTEVLGIAQPIRNLHSTMLLLYPEQTEDALGNMVFTFHYASTLSRSGR